MLKVEFALNICVKQFMKVKEIQLFVYMDISIQKYTM